LKRSSVAGTFLAYAFSVEAALGIISARVCSVSCDSIAGASSWLVLVPPPISKRFDIVPIIA
jgi:hypothetical protein